MAHVVSYHRLPWPAGARKRYASNAFMSRKALHRCDYLLPSLKAAIVSIGVCTRSKQYPPNIATLGPTALEISPLDVCWSARATTTSPWCAPVLAMLFKNKVHLTGVFFAFSHISHTLVFTKTCHLDIVLCSFRPNCPMPTDHLLHDLVSSIALQSILVFCSDGKHNTTILSKIRFLYGADPYFYGS